MTHINAVSFSILIVLFAVVTVVGFAAARWRRAEDLMHLHEWGLGGRGFGSFVTWFLLGGDLYTAYTFIAVPALVYGTGAAGFFTLSYTIMVYPIVFAFLPRLWSVARVHGYITPADFIRGRYGSRGLALAVAFTGILAVMPYIALQLVGIQAVLTVMGIGGSATTGFVHDLPLIIAFIILAGYTFVSGLRAPALIAFIKDTLIYVMIIVAIIYIPIRVGGWAHIFGVADTHLKAINPKTGKPNGSLIEEPAGEWAYATLALGSALALFMYPHTITGVFAAKRRNVIRRNVAALPAYSLVLGLIALLGYMALAAPGGARGGQGPRRERAAGGAVPVPADLPELVRRDRLRGDRHRRPGPGGHHVDRGRQPVHPQHLEGVFPAAGQHRGADPASRRPPRCWSSWAPCSSCCW